MERAVPPDPVMQDHEPSRGDRGSHMPGLSSPVAAAVQARVHRRKGNDHDEKQLRLVCEVLAAMVLVDVPEGYSLEMAAFTWGPVRPWAHLEP